MKFIEIAPRWNVYINIEEEMMLDSINKEGIIESELSERDYVVVRNLFKRGVLKRAIVEKQPRYYKKIS